MNTVQAAAPAAAPAATESGPPCVIQTAQQDTAPGSMVRSLMSNATAWSAPLANSVVQYRINQQHQQSPEGALIDGGANGGLFGDDV